MKKISLSLSIISIFTLLSCGGGEKNEATKETNTIEKVCFYSFNQNKGAQVRWTAFKTTAKTPVGGQFDQVNVSIGEKSSKITDVLQTIKFNIPTASTNTANKDRDAKIVTSFFSFLTYSLYLHYGHAKRS